jgi:hypothetical protein
MSEINDNDTIEPGAGEAGSTFSLVPAGSIDEGTGIVMEFNGKIEPYGENKDGLRFELFYVDDPDARSSLFCKTTEQSGLILMLDIIVMSGVAEKLKKIGKLKSDPSKGLKAAVLKDPAFHEQLKISLQGCRVLCSVKHSKGKYKGNEVTNANISKIAPVTNTPIQGSAASASMSVSEPATAVQSGW